MRTDDFNFDLPETLIAQYPPRERGQSRLMVLDRSNGETIDAMVSDITSFVEPGTLMVFNDSKVRKARLYGICEQTGARVEFIFLSPADALAAKLIVQKGGDDGALVGAGAADSIHLSPMARSVQQSEASKGRTILCISRRYKGNHRRGCPRREDH